MKRYWIFTFVVCASLCNGSVPEVAFTFDDPNAYQAPYLEASQRDTRILNSLKKKGAQAALFVCGIRISNSDSRAILRRWEAAGHLIANHSYSHKNLNALDVMAGQFNQDFLRQHDLLSSIATFVPLFRYPFLKEGNTVEKRDAVRAFLREHGYKVGHVTLDASDWYISSRLEQRLSKDPQAELKPFRDFFIKHMLARADYYRTLAVKVLGHEIKHTVLLHHNLLNALFLEHLMNAFQSAGWKIIAAKEAFSDPVYLREPKIVPAGESLIWALAKESGKFEGVLRYPAESDEYEKAEMDELGL